MISKWQGKTWPRGENSRRFAVKTCDGVRVTSCRHPHINILGNIADNDFFSKIQKILCLSLFKLRWAQKELNWKKENSNTRRVMLPPPSPPPPPPLPPIISKASPSLKDTIMKDHRKGTHFPDIVTGLTMGSTTFEEVGVWWFRSGQEFFAAVRDFFFSCYCKYKTINCNCIFFPSEPLRKKPFWSPCLARPPPAFHMEVKCRLALLS